MLGVVVAMETFCGQVSVAEKHGCDCLSAPRCLDDCTRASILLGRTQSCWARLPHSSPAWASKSQAYGAKRYQTVGTVLQRALILVTIFNVCCVAFWGQVSNICWDSVACAMICMTVGKQQHTCLVPFLPISCSRDLLISCMHGPCPPQAEWLMVAMGQDKDIAKAAGRFTLLLAPCLIMDGGWVDTSSAAFGCSHSFTAIKRWCDGPCIGPRGLPSYPTTQYFLTCAGRPRTQHRPTGADQCCRRYLAAQSVVQPLMFVTFMATLMTPLYLWFFIIRWV